MVVIVCDICGGKRPTDAIPGAVEWILGTDLEVETTRSLRRQLTFYDRWDDRRVLELGAIHLCSEECRLEYIDKSKAA
jgi:hypothetical protein